MIYSSKRNINAKVLLEILNQKKKLWTFECFEMDFFLKSSYYNFFFMDFFLKI
jgi:hypothetical protein